MIRVLGSVTGFTAVMDRVNNFLEGRGPEAMTNSAVAGANEAVRWSVEEMLATPGYRDWTNMPGSHRPSGPPAGYPAIQDGDLVRSFEVEVIGPGQAAWNAGGDEQSKHAYWLEFGRIGSNGKFTMARPFMRKTITEHKDDIARAMKSGSTKSVIGMGYHPEL